MLGGDLGFHAAPRLIVLGDHDRAFDRDAQAVELFVVFGQAVVHEDQRRGDVAVRRIGVVGRKLFRFLVRCRIDRQRWLFQLWR